MSTLVLRVRRGRQLLGTWRLDGQPIEMTLVDEVTGRVVGSFTAAGGEDEPDAVEVNVVEEDRAIVLELTVAPDDLGKVIGKEGRTARAMRTLLSATSARMRKRAILDILE